MLHFERHQKLCNAFFYLVSPRYKDLSGGSSLFYLGAYSMIADLNKRDSTGSATVRLAIMDGIHYLGFYVGNAIAGPVKDNFGLKYNFALGLLFAIIAGAYTLLFIKETLVKQKDENELEKASLEIWSNKNTKGNELRLISFSKFDSIKVSSNYQYDSRQECFQGQVCRQNVAVVFRYEPGVLS